MRVGLIAKKIGMSTSFDQFGDMVPVTLLKVENCQVLDVKKYDNFSKVVVGAFNAREGKVSKPVKGFFSKLGIKAKKEIKEFRVNHGAEIDSGVEVDVRHFVRGQFVDVTGTSAGKGFAGVMKRHNFSGLRASHGVSISHRSHGSTGQCQDPGKVFKNKKMAGHMGDKRVTKQNIQVIDIDAESNIIILKGSVPGADSSVIYIQDSVKRATPKEAPFPCFVEKSVEAPAEVVDADNGEVVQNES